MKGIGVRVSDLMGERGERVRFYGGGERMRHQRGGGGAGETKKGKESVHGGRNRPRKRMRAEYEGLERE